MPQPDGQPFGKYELCERIAAGGMAEIYRARYRAAAGITKQVVIKKILPHYAGNRAFIKMFMDEARIVVGLSHGNIAQVFDFGEIDGEYFLAMELVNGQSLSHILRRARDRQVPAIPTPFAVFIALEMCKGLHYAHTRLDEHNRPLHIVHRDVSPQNVIVSWDGQVKLVDFGIAKARTAGRSETEAGAIKGKYLYFSPEQARGKEIDARTDVFATGTVLYELLCGRLPFEGRMLDVLERVIRCEFPRPRTLNPDVSPALERILLTAMAAERDDRYPSAQAFQEALAGYLYAHAPTFSGAWLSQFLAWLYEPELAAQGHPARLPREFLEQVPLWQKPLPLPPDAPQPSESSSRETAAGSSRRSAARASRGSRGSHGSVGSRGSGPASASLPAQARELSAVPLSRRGKWLLGVVPLFAAGLAAGIVFVTGNFGTFSIQLSATPMGAQVSADGAPPRPTPVLLTHLDRNRSHTLTVTAPGMKPFTRVVEPTRGSTLPLHVVLEPEPRKAPEPSPPSARAQAQTQAATAAAPEPTPRAPDVKYSVNYPTGEIRLKPRYHSMRVPPSHAARLELDPKKTYTMWAEGQASLGGYVDIFRFQEVFFYAQGTELLSADEALGELSPGRHHARTLRHVKELYAFIFDQRPYDNSGAIKVRVQARGEKAVRTLLVDAKENAIYPGERDAVELTGLSSAETYEVLVREGSGPALLRPGRRGRTTHLALVQDTGAVLLQRKAIDDYARVIEQGKTFRVVGTQSLRFFFLDDEPEDDEGELILEVSPVVGTGGTLGTGWKELFGGGR